jgi:hypothetical protein
MHWLIFISDISIILISDISTILISDISIILISDISISSSYLSLIFLYQVNMCTINTYE